MSNESEPRLEEISAKSLPLSDREENPPLVVDLPDGQKLVVGDIKAGTVIEVATWRGTGRPDSRTHRFMLGISHDEPEALVRPTKSETEIKQEVFTETIIKETSIPVVEVPVVEVPVVETPVVIEEEPKIAEATREIVSEVQIEAESDQNESNVTEEVFESDPVKESNFLQAERLSSRTDLLFGASTQYIEKSIAYYPPANPGKQLVAPVKKTNQKLNRKTLIKAGLSLVAVFATVLSLWAVNIGVVHPKSGLSTAMGEASSTVMIVKSKDAYVIGESIVGDSSSQPDNPVFGVVAAVGEGVYMLNAELGYVSINHDEVHGRVIAIAPWWGNLISLLRL